MERKLIDRVETYTKLIKGNCVCGNPVIKVTGSNCTMWKNGDRYHYPDDNTPSCIFRCYICGEPISETFREEKKIGYASPPPKPNKYFFKDIKEGEEKFIAGKYLLIKIAAATHNKRLGGKIIVINDKVNGGAIVKKIKNEDN